MAKASDIFRCYVANALAEHPDNLYESGAYMHIENLFFVRGSWESSFVRVIVFLENVRIIIHFNMVMRDTNHQLNIALLAG